MKVDNRIKKEVERVLDQEKDIIRLYPSFAMDKKALLKERLAQYEIVVRKFTFVNNMDEQFYLRMLKKEIQSIEKQVYKNGLARLFWRLVRTLTRRASKVDILVNGISSHRAVVHRTLKRLGLEHLSPVADLKIKQDKDFNLSGREALGNQKFLDYAIAFKGSAEGKNLDVTQSFQLIDTSADTEFKVKLPPNLLISNDQAKNLIDGRSISIDDNGSKVWLNLDSNDSDSEGNFSVKQYSNYNLDKCLQDVPGSKFALDIEGKLIREALEKGERVPVSLPFQEKEVTAYMQADPRNNQLTYFDQKGNKVDLTKEKVQVHKQGQQRRTGQRKGFKVHG